MPSTKSTSVVFTKEAQVIKDELTPVFGLRKLLSAGLFLFGELSDASQKSLIARVSNSESETPMEQAAEAIRYVLKTYEPLSPEQIAVSLTFLSDDKSRDLAKMLADIASESIEPSQEAETESRSTRKGRQIVDGSVADGALKKPSRNRRGSSKAG